MIIPDGRYEFLEGHIWPSTDDRDDAIVRDYIRSILRGTCPVDEFWETIVEEYGQARANSCRRFVEGGGITETPPKTAINLIVRGGWYWLQHGRDWEIGRATMEGDLRFLLTADETAVPYAEIIEIGPRIEKHGDEPVHDGDHGDCPLCPSPERLANMRTANRERAEARRQAMLASIAAEPAAYVHVVEGYENEDDHSPVTLFVGGTLDRARQYIEGIRSSDGNVFEIAPHRIDAERTGETVMLHCIKKDGVLTWGEGRHYPEKENR